MISKKKAETRVQSPRDNRKNNLSIGHKNQTQIIDVFSSNVARPVRPISCTHKQNAKVKGGKFHNRAITIKPIISPKNDAKVSSNKTSHADIGSNGIN